MDELLKRDESDSKKAKKATKVEPPVVAAPLAAPRKKVRLFTFEQWASRRNVAKHHLGGMKAFVADSQKPRTLEDWDAAFDAY
jgi:hypothetical protein